ncbi:DUF2955 domain-containing protein [Aquipseudomonas ullengensis]|uniref:DUF2955 domain-containing protein n=1 Tax=Aquipseudomonas ullengensis TaxID=2759166 RepID=A0A7W4LNT2_9GAMM|nr:DUF2955 domain-containing protein [Pseudomonas ullengensis]MBB2496543.1 DUF2955 domain-containing protein [Pseudomonas ullengensis]
MDTSAADPRPRRALRLACGVACGNALGFGLGLPLPFLTPMLVLVLLVSSNQPLSAKAGLSLTLVVTLTCGSGLLLSPLLRHSPVSGVLLVALGLFLIFRFSLRGGNGLLATLQIVGLTLITAAGTASLALGQTVVEALVKAVLLTTLCVAFSHLLFPEPANLPPAAKPAAMANQRSNWIALRAMLVVMPAWLLALIDPASYMPLVMKSVNLGQQVCSTNARDAARELLGSTLLGGALAIIFWTLLSILPHLWLFFLLMLLFILLIARRLYRLSSTRFGASFWLNSATTLIILLGQSVQDSAAGKDVYTAFAIRMGLFVLVTLYACAAVYLIDQRGKRPLEEAPCS